MITAQGRYAAAARWTQTAIRAAFIALCATASIPAAAAEEPAPGVFSAQFDNDVFQGQDQNYTSGARFSYVAPMQSSHWLRRGALTLGTPLKFNKL